MEGRSISVHDGSNDADNNAEEIGHRPSKSVGTCASIKKRTKVHTGQIA